MRESETGVIRISVYRLNKSNKYRNETEFIDSTVLSSECNNINSIASLAMSTIISSDLRKLMSKIHEIKNVREHLEKRRYKEVIKDTKVQIFIAVCINCNEKTYNASYLVEIDAGDAIYKLLQCKTLINNKLFSGECILDDNTYESDIADEECDESDEFCDCDMEALNKFFDIKGGVLNKREIDSLLEAMGGLESDDNT